MEQFRNDIENSPDSHVPVTRTLDRPNIQELEYVVQVVEKIDAKKDERILESNKFLSDNDFVKL